MKNGAEQVVRGACARSVHGTKVGMEEGFSDGGHLICKESNKEKSFLGFNASALITVITPNVLILDHRTSSNSREDQ